MTYVYDPQGNLLVELRKLTDTVCYTATVSTTGMGVSWDVSYEQLVADMNCVIDTCQRILNMNLVEDHNE